MLLDNFKAILQKGIKSYTPTVKKSDGNSDQINSNSTKFNYIDPLTTSTYTSAGLSAGNYGLVFGSGTTPPQLDDYNLENVVETFTTSNTNIQFTNYKLILGQVVNATSDMTINEVGVAIYANSSVSKTQRAFLTRTVLSKPVVLTAGQSKTFTVEIDFNTFVDNVNNLQ